MSDIERVSDDNERLFSDQEAMLEFFRTLISEYCQKWNFNEQDIKPLQFKACLNHINQVFIKPNKDMLILPNTYGKYNDNVLLYILYIYSSLCTIYNQRISLHGYLTLTGLTNQTIYDLSNGVHEATGKRVDILNLLRQADKASLEDLLLDKSLHPVKALSILNANYGYSTPGLQKEERNVEALSIEQLPDLSLPQRHNEALPRFSDN